MAKRKTLEHMANLSAVTLSTNGTAALLGITPRRLQMLVRDGTLPSLGRGKFDPVSTVQAYVAFRADGAEKKTGTASLDTLREEKALEIRMNRARKDRDLIALDEAIGTLDEIVGMFVAYLSGLPAEITGAPRERLRLNDIIDRGRIRLADRLAKKIEALRSGEEDPDAEAED